MDPINRRSFLGKARIGAFGMRQLNEAQSFAQSKQGGIGSCGSADKFLAVQRRVTEWAYSSAKVHADPFNEVNLDVVFRDPYGNERRVPRLLGWRTRLADSHAPPLPGLYTFHTVTGDATSSWQVPIMPTFEQWLLVIEREA